MRPPVAIPRIQEYLSVVAARSAPLYHWMEGQKAARVFRTNRLAPMFQHKLIGAKGISLTRNKNYDHQWAGWVPVCLTLDQARLAQRWKIVPLDGERQAYFDRTPLRRRTAEDADYFHDRGEAFRSREGQEMAEEYLIGTIEPLHRYVSHVHVINSQPDNERFLRPLMWWLHAFEVPYSVRHVWKSDAFWNTLWAETAGAGARMRARFEKEQRR